MSVATSTQKAPVLPGTSERHQAGNVIIDITNTGRIYTVTVEYAGTGEQIRPLARTVAAEADAREVARNAYRFFAAGGRVLQGADGTVTLVPAPHLAVAAGTQTKVSDPQVAKLRHAIANGGHLVRGGQQHQATHSTLTALAKRGLITLTGPKYRPTGGHITRAGRIAYLRAAGLDRITYALAA
jgi:hypothetical protein